MLNHEAKILSGLKKFIEAQGDEKSTSNAVTSLVDSIQKLIFGDSSEIENLVASIRGDKEVSDIKIDPKDQIPTLVSEFIKMIKSEKKVSVEILIDAFDADNLQYINDRITWSVKIINNKNFNLTKEYFL